MNTNIEGLAVGTYIEGRVQQALLIKESMFSDQRTYGPMEINGGAFVLDNADGSLDYLSGYAFDGQGVLIHEFDPATGNDLKMMSGLENPVAAPAFDKLTYIIEQAVPDDKVITFQVRDYRHKYDVALSRFHKYGGTNVLPAGIDGTADIKGAPKPLAVGILKNATPVCVNTSKLIYQMDGQRGLLTGYVVVVYDRRAVITQGAVYTSQADMETNAPAAGTTRIWPAGGCYRLNATPLFTTFDLTNPPTASAASSMFNVASFMHSRALDGSIPALFLYICSYNPNVGVYYREEINKLEAMNRICESVGGFIAYSYMPDGSVVYPQMMVAQLNPPGSLPYVPIYDPPLALDETLIEREPELVVPRDPARGIPAWKVNVYYQRNYTVMSPTDLAGIAESDRNFCSREWRVEYSQDVSVRVKYPEAPELNFYTALDAQADASAEAIRLLAVHGVRRRIFRLKIKAEVVRDHVGTGGTPEAKFFGLCSRVTLTHPRHELTGGATFLVIGITRDLKNDMYTILIWG